MSVPFTFTSANTSILVNDKALSGVYTFDVFQKSGEHTSIEIHRHLIGPDDLVNEMRSGDFTFKLLQNNSSAGYVAETAKVSHFHMSLSKLDGGEELLLKQIITVSASAFLYSDDARSAGMKLTEEEDLRNLIEILKKNQAEAQKPEGLVKYGVPPAVLPTDEQFDTIAKQAFEFYKQGEPFDPKEDGKKKKKKKKK